MKKTIIYIILFFYISFIGLLFSQDESSQGLGQSTERVAVDLDYRALQPGEVVKVKIKGISSIKLAEVRLLGKRYFTGKGKSPSERFAFIGIDLSQKPGTYSMVILVFLDDGSLDRIHKEISVLTKDFPLKKLWVKEEFVTPPMEAQERIRRESEILRSVYGLFTPEWLGVGKFIVPSAGEIVPNFGERRIFNNQPRSSHSGVDISSPFGSPVKASNAGKVVLASDLYFAGKTVIIDHGLGVFTLYCHFSKIIAKRGTYVEKGEIIGEIGATGRVTGPHLHWGIKILGSRIDPFSLLSLELE